MKLRLLPDQPIHAWIGVPALWLLTSACGSDAPPALRGASVDLTQEGRDPVGWLGARTRPVLEPVIVDDAGTRREPGAVLLSAVEPDAPLCKAGAQRGDLLVGIGEDWLPLKEDPTFDVLRMVELAISAGKSGVDLKVLRGGKLLELALDFAGRSSLEAGLPFAVQRFQEGARSAVEKLVSMHSPESGWKDPAQDCELGVTALAILAMHGADAAESTAAAASTEVAVRAQARLVELQKLGTSTSPAELALGVLARCESIGPLPNRVVRAAPRRLRLTSGSSPSEMRGVHAGVFQVEASSPEELQKLLESAGGEVSFLSMNAPENGSEPDDLVLFSESMDGEILKGSTAIFQPPTSAPSNAATGLHAPPTVDLSALLEAHDPQRKALLAEVDGELQKLLSMQGEDGGFGDAALVEDERLLFSTLALQACAAFQRVGGSVAKDPIERGCKFLRLKVHDGKVAAAVARGENRRQMAARAASVAATFRALGCPDEDPFLCMLLDYAEQHMTDLLQAPAHRPWHVFDVALMARRDRVSWQRFHEALRLALVAWQEPSGGFVMPCSSTPTLLERLTSTQAGATALGALLLSIQGEQLEILLCQSANPFSPTVDGEGNRQDPKATSADTAPADAMEMVDPAAIENLLKSMGVEGNLQSLMEQGSVQIQSVGSEGHKDEWREASGTRKIP